MRRRSTTTCASRSNRSVISSISATRTHSNGNDSFSQNSSAIKISEDERRLAVYAFFLKTWRLESGFVPARNDFALRAHAGVVLLQLRRPALRLARQHVRHPPAFGRDRPAGPGDDADYSH